MNIEYRILSGTDIGALEAAVQQAIADGWQPHGAAFYCDGQYRKELLRRDAPATEGAAAAEAA